MGRILVRNLDDAVIAGLRRLAAAAGTSTEEQVRRVLTHAVGFDRTAAIARVDEIRHSIGRLEGFSSLDELRRDRDRDGR